MTNYRSINWKMFPLTAQSHLLSSYPSKFLQGNYILNLSRSDLTTKCYIFLRITTKDLGTS